MRTTWTSRLSHAWRDFVEGHRPKTPSFDDSTTTMPSSDADTGFNRSSRLSSQSPTRFLDSSWSRFPATDPGAATSPDGESTPVTLPYFKAAAKLDLARGYLDLGIKTGVRELILEVMRDGSAEERRAAELLLRRTFDA